MTSLLEMTLANALMATALAILAYAVSRFSRQSTLAHALWLLVLLKLVTPSIIDVPTNWFWRDTTAAEPAVSAAYGESDPEYISAAQASSASTEIEVVAEESSASLLLYTIYAIWLGGAVVWFGHQIVQVFAFRRFLREARPAPEEVSAEIRRISLCMGISQPPLALIIDGQVSPMLWALGRRARVILPAALLDELTPAQRETIIAHEVGHFARGDHWVRLIEVIVVGLFWWNPLAWWARYHLQEAEEECCDAKVVSQLPGASRTYAEAILRTLHFLSAPAAVELRSSSGIPATASGAIRAQSLKRRVVLILRGDVADALPDKTKALVVAFACVVLPVGRPGLIAADTFEPTYPGLYERMTHRRPDQVADSFTGNGMSGSKVRLYSDVPILAHTFANGQKRVVVQRQSGAYLKDHQTGLSVLLTHGRPDVTAFSPDGSLVMIALQDQVQVRETASLKVRGTIRTGNAHIRSLAADAQGHRIAVGAEDGTVSVWDSRSSKLLFRHQMSVTPIADIRFCHSVNGLILLAEPRASTPTTLIVWDIARQRPCAYRRCLSLADGQAQLTKPHWDETIDLDVKLDSLLNPQTHRRLQKDERGA